MVSAPIPIRPGATGVIPTLDLNSYLAYQFPTQKEIVSEAVFIRKGRLLVLALKGVGKSQIAMQFGLEVAAQKPVLGIFDVPERAKCLILQKEIPDKHYQDRIKQAARRYGGLNAAYMSIPLQEHFIDMFLDTAQGIFALEQTIAWERPDFVVIDPWDNFHNQDTNNNQAMRNITNTLDRIRIQYDVGFLVCHHLKKPSNDYRGKRITQTMYDTLGASSLINWADTVFTMNEMSKEQVHLEPFMRHGREEPPSIIMKRNRVYSGFDAEVQDEPTGAAEHTALGALVKAGERRLMSDLIYDIQAQKIGPLQAKRAVLRLIDKRLVHVQGSGGDRVIINMSIAARAWMKW